MKRCSKCKQHKPFDEYFESVRYVDGLNCQCKSCHNESSKKWRKANPDKARAAVKRWEIANPEKVKAKSLARRGNLQHHRKAQCRNYNLTVEKFESILAHQNKKCAICEVIMAPPCTDHDHSTGKVRALLCLNCNSGIGKLKDSTELLRRAIKYLEQFSASAEKTNKQKHKTRK